MKNEANNTPHIYLNYPSYMSGGQETLNPTKVVEYLRPLNETTYSSMTSPRTTENIQSSKRPSEPQRRRKKARKKREGERERERERARELARAERERERARRRWSGRHRCK
jgi:hypothetical protein